MCTSIFIPYFTLLNRSLAIIAKHRNEKEKRDKDKEEIKIKEETDVKLNHSVKDERFHYNLNVKQEIKEVSNYILFM